MKYSVYNKPYFKRLNNTRNSHLVDKMLHTCMAREKKCEVVPLVGSEGTEGLEQECICGVWHHHGGVTAVAQVGQQSQNL